MYVELLNELNSDHMMFNSYGSGPTKKANMLFSKIIDSRPLINTIKPSIYFDLPELSDIYNKASLQRNYEDLYHESNKQIFLLKKRLNPFYSLEDLLLLPMTILEFLIPIVFNFKLKKSLSTLTWLFGIIFNLYSQEIKTFITNLFT